MENGNSISRWSSAAVIRITLAMLVIVLAFAPVRSSPQRCRNNEDCSFGGICMGRTCRCRAACRSAGFIPICASDGRFYMNACYLNVRSCEVGRKIEIKHIGYHEHCKKHPFAKWAAMSTDLNHTPCATSANFCENYSVCITQHGASSCLCPKGFHGHRCHIKLAPKSPSRRYSRLATGHINSGQVATSRNATYPNHSRLVAVLVLCVSSALLSSLVTAAWFQRMRIKSIRRRATESWHIAREIEQSEVSCTTSAKQKDNRLSEGVILSM